MKKTITSLLVVAFVLSGLPSAVFADTTTVNPTALTTQISSLDAQILALQQQRKVAIASLNASMSLGTQGDNVKLLQAFLAADPSLYPEGIISGFYGKKTVAAIKRFQKLNDLPQVGRVGPMTLAILNAQLAARQAFIASLNSASTTPSATAWQGATSGPYFFGATSDKKNHERDDEEDDDHQGERKLANEWKQFCAPVTRGHMTAPGWNKKHEGKSYNQCVMILPWWSQYGGRGTTTPPAFDTSAPLITSIGASVTPISASVYWTTNENSDTQVFYGTTTAYGTQTTLMNTLVTAHSQSLSGLLANTTYHYQVRSKDASGNLATSADQTFTTLVSGDVTAPVITAIGATVAPTTATVSWTTGEIADTQVAYGTTTAYGSLTTLLSPLVTFHSQSLSALSPSTVYHYQVRSKDLAGNLATSNDQTLTTSVAPDITAPIIASLVASPSSTTTTITWNTNEPATGKVYYGTSSPVTLGSALNISSTIPATVRTLTLSSLATSTTYYFVAESVDSASNSATSTGTFTTLP